MEKQLVYRRSGQVKYWKYQLVNTRLYTYTGKDPEKLRIHEKEFATAQEALDFVRKAERKKLNEGFVYLGDWQNAAFGDVIFHMQVPDRSESSFFAVHPTKPLLAIGTIKKDAHMTALYLVNYITGEIEKSYDEFPDKLEKATLNPMVIHSVHFSQSGRSLYVSVNEKTMKIDLEVGDTTVLAEYQEFSNTNFNPFCVFPVQDKARAHLLVFTSGGLAQVLDHNDKVIFQKTVESQTAECRGGMLSPSGTYAAFYIVSRYLIYGNSHSKAISDKTSEVQVWHVARQELIKTLPIDIELRRVGFSPSEDQLVISRKSAQGPAFYDISSGEKIFHFKDPFRSDRWQTCFSWDFSNAGNILAVGGFGVRLFQAGTQEEIELPYSPLFSEKQRVYRLLFSPDDRFLVSGGDQGDLFVRKIS